MAEHAAGVAHHRLASLPNVPMRATADEPYFSVTYWTTRSRPATEKSVSMSGMVLRPG